MTKKKIEGDESRDSFRKRWDQVGFCLLTSRPADTLIEGCRTTATTISLSWPDLPDAAKASFLGVSLRSHPEHFGAFQMVRGAQELCAHLGPYTLERWAERVEGMLQFHRHGGTKPETVTQWPNTQLTTTNDVPHHAITINLAHRIAELRGYPIWDKPGPSVGDRVAGLCAAENPARVMCLDLGSLEEPEQRYITTAAALETLWSNARQAWSKALASPSDQDQRCPVFIVIDEAHNIAPAEAIPEAARPTLETLVRIAMEGRKYGLFLILATQRPARVNSNLLSQCDNLILMKMSNPADVRLAEERFGFIPSGWAERALEFKKGEVLLCGQFADRPAFAQVASRRTVEGGRSLRDSVWLTDPMSGRGKP